MSEISPVILIGLNRNGTTWLCNELLGCFDIISHEHPLHYGFKEPYLHTNRRFWGDLNKTDRLIRFLEAYSGGDLFQLAKGDKEYFYEHPPKNFYDFYFNLMDRFCAKEGKQHWLTKISIAMFQHPEEWADFLEQLKARYSKVYFVGIKREYRQYINSYSNMIGYRNTNKNALYKQLGLRVTGSAYYYGFYPKIEAFLKEEGGLLVLFEDLKTDHATTMSEIGAYLQMDFLYQKKELPQNTSYTDGKKSELKGVTNIIERLFSRIPILSRWVVWLRRNSKQPYPVSYRLLKQQFFTEKMRTEFKNSNQLRLLEYIEKKKEE